MTTIETSLIDFSEERSEWDGPHTIADCKRALSPSSIQGISYALNPYGGCSHGCVYCYAPGYTHSDPSRWRVVQVRRNIADRLARELPSTDGTIGVGTVTDPYQPAESRFLLTRRCLDILASRERHAIVYTKSDLVLRDREMLRGMGASVGITVTSADDRTSKITEPGAPLPSARFRALEELVSAGVDTYALVSPVMSTLSGHEEELADAISKTGVCRVFVSSLDLRHTDSDRLGRMRIGQDRDAELRLISAGRALGLDVRRFRDRHPDVLRRLLGSVPRM